MSTRHARPVIAAPAAVLAAVLGVTTAPAATWTVRPGGPVSLTSGQFVVRDTTTASQLS